jgi:hypothetical protein
MTQRQHLHREADPDALGPRGNRAGDAERRRQHRPRRVEVQLPQPHRIEAPTFGVINQIERLRKGLGVGSSGQGRKLMEDAKFHRGRFPDLASSRHSPAGHTIMSSTLTGNMRD